MNTPETKLLRGRPGGLCDPEHRPTPMSRLATGRPSAPGPAHGLLVPIHHLELVAGLAALPLHEETALSAIDFP